jgi:hypothetical protein
MKQKEIQRLRLSMQQRKHETSINHFGEIVLDKIGSKSDNGLSWQCIYKAPMTIEDALTGFSI